MTQTQWKTNHFNCLCLVAEQNEANPRNCRGSVIKLASLHLESTPYDPTLHSQRLKPGLRADGAQTWPSQRPEICRLNTPWPSDLTRKPQSIENDQTLSPVSNQTTSKYLRFGFNCPAQSGETIGIWNCWSPRSSTNGTPSWFRLAWIVNLLLAFTNFSYNIYSQKKKNLIKIETSER